MMGGEPETPHRAKNARGGRPPRDKNSDRRGTAKARGMRGVFPVIAAAAAALAVAVPRIVQADEARPAVAPFDAALAPTPPADTGKPALTLPPAFHAPDPNRCVPALPCGSRLIGEVRKNGAVMLQVPALRW